VDWTPRGNSVNKKRFTWETFAELLENGTVPVEKRKATRRPRTPE